MRQKALELKTSNYKSMIADNSCMNEKQKLDDLAKVIGKNRKCGYKVGDNVPAYVSSNEVSKIIKIEKDLLGNEVYFTEFNLHDHVKPEIKKLFPDYEFKISEIFKILILYLKIRSIIKSRLMYGKKYENKTLFLFANIGKESQKFFTLICRDKMLDKTGKRYKIIYEVK